MTTYSDAGQKNLGTSRPLVTVLMPSYNGATYLREALESVLAQTYAPLELILLDDASTDETQKIVGEYGDRIVYIRQPVNRGIYENVNTGIAMAKGQYVATYHADDIYLPTMVESQVAFLERHPEVGAVFASDIFVDADGREYGRLKLPAELRGERALGYPQVLNALLTYKNRFLVCPTAMVRASVHAAVGVYDQGRYRNTADLEMWLRIAKRFPIAVLESHLMKYRHFHGNSSQRYHRLRTAPENYFGIIDEYLSTGSRSEATAHALANYEGHRAQDRLMAAISHYVKGELGEGRTALRQVGFGTILAARQLQRNRLVVLRTAMWCLLRLPRSEWLARRMVSRWHTKRPPRRRTWRALHNSQ